MVAIMLDFRFKYLRIVENYVSHGGSIFCLAFEYDAKVVIPLLMGCFDRLNHVSQACVATTDVPISRFEK
jgi:hypothetical protein